MVQPTTSENIYKTFINKELGPTNPPIRSSLWYNLRGAGLEFDNNWMVSNLIRCTVWRKHETRVREKAGEEKGKRSRVKPRGQSWDLLSTTVQKRATQNWSSYRCDLLWGRDDSLCSTLTWMKSALANSWDTLTNQPADGWFGFLIAATRQRVPQLREEHSSYWRTNTNC